MILSLRNRLKVLIYTGALVVFIMSLLDRGPKLGLTRQRLAVLEMILFGLLTTFDRYAWRLGPIPQLLKTGPVLRGTWKGEVRPTSAASHPLPAYLSVRQTYSSVAFRLLTDEATSESTTARLVREEESRHQGEYSYESIPRDSVRDRSPIHFGSVRFQCVGERPTRLQGEYFTSRRTTGELSFGERRDAVVHSFSDARTLFGDS